MTTQKEKELPVTNLAPNLLLFTDSHFCEIKFIAKFLDKGGFNSDSYNYIICVG